MWACVHVILALFGFLPVALYCRRPHPLSHTTMRYALTYLFVLPAFHIADALVPALEAYPLWWCTLLQFMFCVACVKATVPTMTGSTAAESGPTALRTACKAVCAALAIGYMCRVYIGPILPEMVRSMFNLIIGLAAFDCAFYWWHRLLHTPWWYKSLHHVHHAASAPGVLDGLVNHPIEMVINNIMLFAAVRLCGCGTAAQTILVIAIIVATCRHHAGGDPDHYLHHEARRFNYGTDLAVWDKLFGTYCAGKTHK